MSKALVVVSFTLEQYLTFHMHSSPTFYPTIYQTFIGVHHTLRFILRGSIECVFWSLAETHSPTTSSYFFGPCGNIVGPGWKYSSHPFSLGEVFGACRKAHADDESFERIHRGITFLDTFVCSSVHTSFHGTGPDQACTKVSCEVEGDWHAVGQGTYQQEEDASGRGGGHDATAEVQGLHRGR